LVAGAYEGKAFQAFNIAMTLYVIPPVR
jgi:hypothetical protein